jgi:hypothetical protein
MITTEIIVDAVGSGGACRHPLIIRLVVVAAEMLAHPVRRRRAGWICMQARKAIAHGLRKRSAVDVER